MKIHAQSHGVNLRHYLISSGLTEIVEGTRIYKRFHNVFASEYWFEAYELPYPKRVITDTGKTQYLFRINKGVEDLGESINQHMPEGERPIPFSNMIYFGDGDTDVPSMAVMRKNGGHAVAVHPPGKAQGQVRRPVQGRPLRFLRARRLPARLGPVQAHLPAARPHAGRHPRAGGDVAAGAGAEVTTPKDIWEEHAQIVHYTDQAGLEGILTSQALHATHYDYLNDTSELKRMEEPLAKAVAPLLMGSVKKWTVKSRAAATIVAAHGCRSDMFVGSSTVRFYPA